MSGFLKRLLSPGGSGSEEEVKERIGEHLLDVAPVKRLLSASPRDELIKGVLTRLQSLRISDLPDLVERVLIRFTVTVWDLPASQNHHHSRSFGLLDHSLEVASETVTRLVDEGYAISKDPRDTGESRREWIYGAFVAGLFHDLGKLLDVEVMSPEAGDLWNPHAEPLAVFLSRNGHTGTEGLRNYRKGRRDSHRWHGPLFYGGVLSREASARLGYRLALLSDAFLGSAGGGRPTHVPEPAWEIAKLVSAHDIESSRSDREGGRDPASKEPDEIDWARTFREAIECEVAEGRLPVNQASGLVVGKSRFYLERWQGLERVVASIERLGVPLAAWWTEGKIVVPPMAYVLDMIESVELLAEVPPDPSGAFPMDFISPGKPSKARAYIVLRHPAVPRGLPIFEGRLVPREKGVLGEDGLFADPSSLVAGPEAGMEQKTLTSESYGRRLEAELEPERLFESLREAIREDVIGLDSRGGEEVTLFADMKHLWVVYGGAFRVLAGRLGLAWSPELGDRMVEALSRQQNVLRWKDKDSILVEILASSDAHREWLAVGIPPGRVYSAAELSKIAFPPEAPKAVAVWPDRASEWRLDEGLGRF